MPPVHRRGSVAGQPAGQDNGVADERISAATAPCGMSGCYLSDQRGHPGNVRRGHRCAADPHIAPAAAHDGAIGTDQRFPCSRCVGARPAGENAPAPEYRAGVWAASPPGAVTSTGEPTFE